MMRILNKQDENIKNQGINALSAIGKYWVCQLYFSCHKAAELIYP
jgi:hypothetical protein